MKSLHARFLIWLWAICALGLRPASAELEVSASVAIHSHADFHAPLAAHGAWIEFGSYGQCWHPSQVAVEWRPYCDGHWVWTDCGWYWASDEPWAWACYHYGSWTYDGGLGWVWVPGVEWAPAWVTWRFGGGYCGWAPLAPRGIVLAPREFVFVEAHRFHEPVRSTTVIVNNTTIINQTKVLNAPQAKTLAVAGSAPRKVMFNEGPGVAPIAQATHQQIRAVPVQEATRQTPVPATLNRKPDRQESKPKSGAPAAPQPEAKPSPPASTSPGQPRVEPPDAKREPKPAPRETPSHPGQPEQRRPDRPPGNQEVRPTPPAHPPGHQEVRPAPPAHPDPAQPPPQPRPKGPPGKKGEERQPPGKEHEPPGKEKLP